MEFEAKDGCFYFRVKHLKIIFHWGKMSVLNVWTFKVFV